MQRLNSRRFPSVLLILLILMVMGRSGAKVFAQASEPTAETAAEQVPIFTAIQMINKTDGWAVATMPDDRFPNSDAYDWQTYAGKLAYVLHTEDGGQHWTDVTPVASTATPEEGQGCDCSDNGVAGFFFLDATHAWVMMDDMGFPGNQVFDGISVRSTSDGGKSWTRSSTGMNAPYVITSSFIDATHGWILAGNTPAINSPDQPALLYRTSDGANWELIADDGTYTHPDGNPNGPAQPVSPVETGITPMRHQGMTFESASSGWILAEYEDALRSYLLHTTDGGVTWTPLDALADLKEPSCGADLLTVDAAGIIFWASCDSGDFLNHSSDDGKSWRHHPIPATLLQFGGWPQLFMQNALIGWGLGCDEKIEAAACNSTIVPFLYKTADAGQTWNQIEALPEALQPIPSPIDGNILPKFEFVDDQTGWAISPVGGLYTTTDGGKSWTAIEPNFQLHP